MDKENLKNILAFLAERKGRLLGAVFGVIIFILWATLGFWKTTAFFLCVAIGYFAGYQLDRKDAWREIIKRILPPTE